MERMTNATLMNSVWTLSMGLTLAIAGTPCVLAQKSSANDTYVRTAEGGWVMGNSRFEAVVSGAEGSIMSFRDKARRNSQLLNGGAARCELRDETGRLHLEPSPVSCTTMDHEQLVLTKSPYHEGISAEIRYTLGVNSLRWDVTIASRMPADTGVTLTFRVPCIGAKTHIFTPSVDGPLAPDQFSRKTYKYKTIDYPNMTFIPMGTVFDPQEDTGLTVFATLDFPKPRMRVDFDKENGDHSLQLSVEHLRLKSGGQVRASVELVPHAGDWRPGLGFFVDKYPAYFEPAINAIYRYEGSSVIAGVSLADKSFAWQANHDRERFMKYAKRMGLTWQEVHFTFPHYGLYVPDGKSWTNVYAVEDPHHVGATMSYPFINEYLGFLTRSSVAAAMYYQVFECYEPYAAKGFAGDIIRNRDNSTYTGWQHTVAMNPDPSGAWGKYIMKQLEGVLTRFPRAAGIFLDRPDYVNFDFAKDDGISRYEGQSCYMTGFAFEKALARVTDQVHARGKCVWTGQTYVEGGRNVDGIFTDGGAYMEAFAYGAIRRPVSFFCDSNEPGLEPIEAILKRTLQFGAQPHISYVLSEPVAGLFAKYLPLFSFLKNRSWVLEAHALTLPEGVKGNIFKNGNGQYVVTMVALDPAMSCIKADRPFRKDLPVRITLKEAPTIREIRLLSADDAEVRKIPFTLSGQAGLNVVVPRHRSSSILVLSPGGEADGHSPQRIPSRKQGDVR